MKGRLLAINHASSWRHVTRACSGRSLLVPELEASTVANYTTSSFLDGRRDEEFFTVTGAG